jgi:K+-transporting ATPase ATPase A chain
LQKFPANFPASREYTPETGSLLTASSATQFGLRVDFSRLGRAADISAIALIRSFARRSAQTIGNFWVDMTRTVLYVPISIVVGLFFVWHSALPRRRREFMPFDGRSL